MKHRIFPLAVVPATVPLDVSSYLREQIRSGSRVTRYGREWIIGGVETAGAWFLGRIGYNSADAAEVFDEGSGDFREVAVPSGAASPFAFDTDRMVIYILPRGGHTKLNGIIGALESILNNQYGRWKLEATHESLSFTDWLSTLERVTSILIAPQKPNPHYGPAESVKDLLEAAKARVARVSLENAEDGIDVTSEFIQQSVTHAERDYGHYKLSAIGRVLMAEKSRRLAASTGSKTKALKSTRTSRLKK